LRIRHRASDGVKNPVVIQLVRGRRARAYDPGGLLDFGDDQIVPGIEGKGERSVAERILHLVFARSPVALDRVCVNQTGPHFGDVEERSGIV
jgi:hypothetical protein